MVTRRNVAVTSLVLVVLVSVTSCTSNRTLVPASPTVAASPEQTPPAPATSLNPSAGSDDDGVSDDPPTTEADPLALQTAVAFIRAWAHPELNQQQWLAGISALATPAYRGLLATVDPRSVPAHTITGPAVAVTANTFVVVVDVPTDAGPIRVNCERDAGRWLVATVEPAGRTR